MAKGTTAPGADERGDASTVVRKRGIQAAFRQRQKAKVKDLEQQVQALHDSLDAMRLQRTRQEGELEMLKQLLERQFDPDAKGHVPAQQPQHTDSYVQHLEQLLREQSATAQQAAAELDRREAFVPPAEDAMQLDSEGAEAFAVLLRIMRSPDTSGTTLAECRAMKPADLLSIYKEAREHFGMLLEGAASVAGSPAAVQLELHVKQYLQCMLHTWRNCFPLFHAYTALLLKDTAGVKPPPGHTNMLLAALALTDEQVASICTEYDNMTAALNAVYSEQKAMLSNTVEVQAQTLMTDQLLGLQWVSSRLQCVLLEFCEAFNLRILTARQFATGMVSAAPHSMNVVALGGALVARSGRPPATPVDSGMAQVLTWLFSGGSSSVGGGDAASQDLSVSSMQDALDEIDPDDLHGQREELGHHVLHARHDTRRSSVISRPGPLDPDPLMRAAAELLAENALLLAQQSVTA